VLVLAVEPASLITEIRLGQAWAQLAQSGRWQVQFEAFHLCTSAQLLQADLVIAQRPSICRHHGLLRIAASGPAAIVVELDDLLTEPASHLIHSAFMRAQAVWVQRSLALADLVSVSTPRLGDAVRRWAPEQAVVPNCAGLRQPPPVQATPPVSGPTASPATASILLAASDRICAGALVEALRRLQAERGEALRLVAVGAAAEGLASQGLRVEVLPMLSRADFLALARGLPNAVAAIPLDDSPFSACKSAIKWMDYGAVGVPVVASAVPPYADAIEHDRTGALVSDDPHAWLQALRRALDDQAWRARVTTAAQAEVQARWTLPAMALAWEAAAQAALARRAQRAPVPYGPWGGARKLLNDLLAGARRWNRQRLQQRRGRCQPPSPVSDGA
jgi:hypothetical protein